MELKQAFGMALRQMRKSRHLSQEDFGGYSSQIYLSQLESGGTAANVADVTYRSGQTPGASGPQDDLVDCRPAKQL